MFTPTPGTYMAIDRASGKRVTSPVTPATVTIPMDAGAPAERNQDPRLAVKHLQKFAFNYLAATIAAVSSNLRKIFDFFVKTAERDSGESLSRERRRKEATGTPLNKHSALPSLAPPQ
ncbi:hypothetical protein [Cryobacterium sp. M25]|uniref:hypothetical protein n=1 Tax=Cryobacterium sp. M25 TaxID=2048293 RepID=UPI000CE464F1|nr:hypothetical protein [Cryobacterium sp. M25]